MGGLANGGSSNVDGTNNNRNGGLGDNNGNGGPQGKSFNYNFSTFTKNF